MKGNNEYINNRHIVLDDKCYVLDILSVTRTHMANERTLLAYLNTFLAMAATGVGLIKLTNDITFVNIGFVLLAFSVLIPIIGVYRFIRIRKLIKKKICLDENCNSKATAL